MSTLTATIQADTSGFNAAVEKASKELKLFDKSNKNLASTMKSVNKVTDSQVDAFNKSIKSLKQVADGNKNTKQSAKILKDEIDKLNRQWRNLSNEAKKGEFGKAMSEAMRSANKELSNLKVNASSAFNEVSKGVDKTKNELKGFEGLLHPDKLFNLSNLTNVISGIGNIYTKVAALVVSLSDKLKVNEGVLDSWGRRAEGLSSVVDGLFRVLAGNTSMSSVFYSYGLGKNKYNAEDDLGSYIANNAEWYGDILYKTQDYKTKKKEGNPATDKEIDDLISENDKYYNGLITYLKNRNKAYIKEVEGNIKDPKYNFYVPILLDEYLKAKDANSVVNKWKEEMEEYNLEDIQSKMFLANPLSEEYKDLKKKRDAILDPTSRYSALNKLISMETSHLQKLKQNTAELKSQERERERLKGEILEAKATPTKTPKDREEKQKYREKKAFEDLWKDYLETGELKTIADVRKRIELTQKAVEVSSDPIERYAYAKNLAELQKLLEDMELDTKTADLRPIDINETMKKLNEKYKDKSSKDNIEKLKLETTAVNNLSQAWGNLWEIIDTGDETTTQTLKALGGAVTDAANMFKTLAENELAASQAVALGKATASASGLPFPYNLVAIGTVAATVTSMFAKFASIGKFAEGGIVGGSSTIGDYNIARVNSGEMILNGSQQKRLFNMLNGSSGLSNENTGGQTVELVVRGHDLVGVLNNYNKKINRVK